MPPPGPHLVNGTVRDIFKVKLEGATVVLTRTSSSETLTVETNSDGFYQLNLGSLSDYSEGDALTIKASKTGEGSKTVSTTVSSGGGQTEDINLEEEEQVNAHVTGSTAVGETAIVNKSIIVDHEKAEINHSNPLPVRLINKNGVPVHNTTDRKAKKSGTNFVEYMGFAQPGSSEGDAVWQIKKLTYDGNFNTGIIYPNGDDRFAFKWSDRESYTYK